MLFQPTNVIPDLKTGIGMGVVDARDALDISWQVNGDYPVMTGMKIDLYVNDEESTQIYTTGKVTFSSPFYGANALGEPQYYKYTIPRSELAGLDPQYVNGHEYKIIITQYYDDRGTEKSVTQSSASVFITRRVPVFEVTPSVPDRIESSSYTFEIDFSQSNGDTLDWVRYQIAQGADTEEPIYDSGPIYGAAVYTCTYASFRTGYNYSFRAMGQTNSGVLLSTGWIMFSVEYEVSTVAGGITVGVIRDVNGVAVGWSNLSTVANQARWVIFREQEGSGILARVADVELAVRSITDYGVPSGQGPYTYLVIAADGSSELIGTPVRSPAISPVFYRWTLIQCEENSDGSYTAERQFHFRYNMDSGAISNNNAPGVLQNFTPNPTVQPAPQNYRSGTLKALVGTVENGRYRDSLAVRKALMALSVTEDPLVLKSSKGDVMLVRLNGSVTATIGEKTESLAQTVSVPWIALDDAANAGIWSAE